MTDSDLRGTPPAREAEILASLPLRQRPELYIAHPPGAEGLLTIMERGTAEAEGVDGIVGLALNDDADGNWYLGCVVCSDQIEESDAGVCKPCRQDLALEHAQRRIEEGQ